MSIYGASIYEIESKIALSAEAYVHLFSIKALEFLYGPFQILKANNKPIYLYRSFPFIYF
jgi:hypothetical protein